MTKSNKPPDAATGRLHHDKNWLEENSPRHEAEYSGILSAIFHFCLLMILSLIAGWQHEQHSAPAVDVIAVSDASSSADASADDLPGNDSLEMTTETEEFPFPQFDHPQETLQQVDPTKIETDVSSATESLQSNVAEQARKAAQAAAALDGLNQQLNNAAGGAPATGATGSGSSGRAGRAARWILRFDTRSPRHYIEQLEGLGAELAFPETGDQWRYFDNLTAASPTTSLRDLSRETRIYWVDQNPQTYRAVGNLLGARDAPMMVVFLPIVLEQRMLEMELNYMGRKEEEDILQTEFVVVRRGGKLDVQVQSQRLR